MIDEKKLIEDIHKYFGTKLDEGALIPQSLYKAFFDGLMEMNKDICGIIKNQPKVGEWIPCSKRLPEEFKNVLACGRTGFIFIAKRSGDSWFEDSGLGKVYVIAWMPLPKPYREDGESDATD